MSSTKTSTAPCTAITARPMAGLTSPEQESFSSLDAGQIFRERSFGATGLDALPLLTANEAPADPLAQVLATPLPLGALHEATARRHSLSIEEPVGDLSPKLFRALVILAAVLAMLLLADLAQAQLLA
jgi:hypothetical protein